MNGKFCIVENKVTKEKTKVFMFSEKGWGDSAVYKGLEVSDDSESVHLDYVIHNITREALDEDVEIETIQECARDAVAELGGSFDVDSLIRTFAGSDVRIYVDLERDDYWSTEESSSEEDSGSY